MSSTWFQLRHLFFILLDLKCVFSPAECLCGAADFGLWVSYKRGDPKWCSVGPSVLLFQWLWCRDTRGQYTHTHTPKTHVIKCCSTFSCYCFVCQLYNKTCILPFICVHLGMSWNQHCDDQHRPAPTGLLQLWRGALQVLILKTLKAYFSIHDFFLPLLDLPLVFVVARPNTYHSNLQVSWDLNTGVCCTVGVGDLTEVRGQTRWRVTAHRRAFRLLVELGLGSVGLKVSLFFVSLVSGSVWSSYRKSCVNMVMKWLVPESSSRYINRMTNEALHKGEHTCPDIYLRPLQQNSLKIGQIPIILVEQ